MKKTAQKDFEYHEDGGHLSAPFTVDCYTGGNCVTREYYVTVYANFPKKEIRISRSLSPIGRLTTLEHINNFLRDAYREDYTIRKNIFKKLG